MITPSTQYSLVPYFENNQGIIVRSPQIVDDCRVNHPNAFGKEHFFERINQYEDFIETYDPTGIYNEKSHIAMPESNTIGLLVNIYA